MSNKSKNKNYHSENKEEIANEPDDEDLNYACMFENSYKVKEILKRDRLKLSVDYVRLAIHNKNYSLVCELILRKIISIDKIENDVNPSMIKYLVKNDSYDIANKLMLSEVAREQFLNIKIIKLMLNCNNNVTVAAINRDIIDEKIIKKYAKSSNRKKLLKYVTFNTSAYFYRVFEKSIEENDLDALHNLDFDHMDAYNLCDYLENLDKKAYTFFREYIIPKFDMSDICEALTNHDCETILSILFEDINGYSCALDSCFDTRTVVSAMKEHFTKGEIIDFFKENNYDREEFSISLPCDNEESCETCPSCEDCGRRHMSI